MRCAAHEVTWHWVKGHADNAGQPARGRTRQPRRGMPSAALPDPASPVAPRARTAARRPAFPFAPACRRAPATAMPLAYAASASVGAPGSAQRPAEQLPRRRVLRVQRDGAAQVAAALAASPAFMYSLPSEKRSSAPSLPRRASSGSGRAQPVARSGASLHLSGAAALAVDPPHRVDDRLVLAVDLALDVRVQPPPWGATIEDALRKLVGGIGEREDRVGAFCRRSRSA